MDQFEKYILCIWRKVRCADNFTRSRYFIQMVPREVFLLVEIRWKGLWSTTTVQQQQRSGSLTLLREWGITNTFFSSRWKWISMIDDGLNKQISAVFVSPPLIESLPKRARHALLWDFIDIYFRPDSFFDLHHFVFKLSAQEGFRISSQGHIHLINKNICGHKSAPTCWTRIPWRCFE